MRFGFNQIGEYLAGRTHTNGVVPLSLFGKEHALITEGIFVPAPKGACPKAICPKCGEWAHRDSLHAVCENKECGEEFELTEDDLQSVKFDAHGLERFLAHRLAHDWTQPVSNGCRLGEASGRTLYYIDKPKRNFFTMHRGKVSVILGSNDAEPPESWDGYAVLLSELFYLDKESKNIRVAQDICRRLLPPVRGQRKLAANTPLRHERRAEWLQYFLTLLSPLLKNPKAKIKRPGFPEAKAYFLENFPGMPENTRTYRRDIDEMTGSDKAASKYDKKDELISRIWKHFEDPVYIREAHIIEDIVDELGKIRADRGETKSSGVIASGAWQKVRGEDRCERTAYVNPSLDIDRKL